MAILATSLLGCGAVPHVDSKPNVELIDIEHSEEDEFVRMQPRIQRASDPQTDARSSNSGRATEELCMRKVQAQVVETRQRNWSQAMVDAALDECIRESRKP